MQISFDVQKAVHKVHSTYSEILSLHTIQQDTTRTRYLSDTNKFCCYVYKQENTFHVTAEMKPSFSFYSH